MSFIPPKIVCLGDENKCAHYMGPAREFLRRTVYSMSFQDLKQLEDSKRFSDGTVIHVVHRFGESVINIYCPYDVPEEEEKEEEVIEEGTERKAHFFIKFIVPRPEDDSFTYQDLVLVRHITFDEDWSLQGNVLTGPGSWTRGIRVGDRLGDSSDGVITGVSDNSLTFAGDPLKELIVQVTISIYRLVDRVIQPDEEEGKEREFGAAWVWFDRDQVYGTQTMVFLPGDQWEGDVAAPVPPDAVENVGFWHLEIIQKITGTLTTENFGGKSFELSYDDVDGKKQTNRYASYTGNVPLLFREGELLYKGAPCLDIYQDPDMPTIYMANMHKMIVQNDKHVAWYYFKQEPYFIDSIRGEMDMRFTVCTLDLVTIVGDEMEIAVATPRAKMRGGSSRVSRDATTTLNYDETGERRLREFEADWLAPWAGWYEILQFPQSMHLFLDLKEVDAGSFADDAHVTLYMCSEDALVEARYSLHPDDKGDMGYGEGYSYGGYQAREISTVVTEGKSWVWTKDGFKAVPTIEYQFDMEGIQMYPPFSEFTENLGERLPVFGMLFWDFCGREDTWRRTGRMFGCGGQSYFLPGVGTFGVYSLGFFYKGVGSGRALRIYKKYIANCDVFDIEQLQRYYKRGDFQAGGIAVGDGRVWGDLDKYHTCPAPRYYQYAPLAIRWQYAEGLYRGVIDHNLFGFLWHEMYNDPWATGCEMFMPNIFVEKGRSKRSRDSSSSLVNSQSTGPVPSSIYPVGDIPDYGKGTCESWYGGEDVPFTLDPSEGSAHHNPATWQPVTGYMSGGGERRGSSWEASDSTDETILHCSDGTAPFTLPADAWEYYFMDDRSVTDEPQGVFLACKTATTWRFFHFWEGAGTIKEVTNEIWKGLGFTTPQQRASIQCIGVI